MENTENNNINATIGNTVLPAVPFMAKWKGHYGAVKVKAVNNDKAIVEIRFANPYLNYEKEANVKDLEPYHATIAPLTALMVIVLCVVGIVGNAKGLCDVVESQGSIFQLTTEAD